MFSSNEAKKIERAQLRKCCVSEKERKNKLNYEKATACLPGECLKREGDVLAGGNRRGKGTSARQKN